MLSRIFSATPHGIEASIIAVEVAYNPGLPALRIVGLPDTAIRESRERIRSCLRNFRNIEYPIGRIVINLAPASLPKYGTQFDLAIAIGIMGIKRRFRGEVREMVFIAELSLDGRVRPVKGSLAMVLAAKKNGYVAVVLPIENIEECVWVSGIEIYPVKTIEECLKFCEGTDTLARVERSKDNSKVFIDRENIVDLKDIQGLQFAKRGLEIAAAGGHNVLLSGSPGLGKTMLAQSLSSILPPLEPEQFLQTLVIHSMHTYGGRSKSPPFRAPLPGITQSAFIGGGLFVQPGEVTLAHNGVLFMDEFPEFPRAIIDSLRQPLETGYVVIARMREHFKFPARFIFIAAQNLCPCGNYGDTRKECTCSALQVARYQKKVSGPILDRIDIHIRLQRSNTQESGKHEESCTVRERVIVARNIQLVRNPTRTLNAYIPQKVLQEITQCTPKALELLDLADSKFAMSMRSRAKIIKIARTIADLSGVPEVSEEHIVEALRYRFSE